jgi:hypothetical protein
VKASNLTYEQEKIGGTYVTVAGKKYRFIHSHTQDSLCWPEAEVGRQQLQWNVSILFNCSDLTPVPPLLRGISLLTLDLLHITVVMPENKYWLEFTAPLLLLHHVAPSIRKKLAITSPTSGGRLVGIVRSRTQTME